MTIIIGDMGSNHEGSLTKAKELMHAFAEAGGTIFKGQMFKPEQYPHNLPTEGAWYLELEEYAAKLGIGFFCSWFYDPKRTIPMAKISYSQRHNFSLIRAIEGSNGLVIMSGDSNTLWPIKPVLKLLCAPSYPAKEEDYLKHFETHPITQEKVLPSIYSGISDHTVGTDFYLKFKPNIWEKHFKMGDEKTSPDAGEFAITPNQLKEVVNV